MNEAAVQQQVRLKAAYAGLELWRNNSGAFTDDTGRMVRFGLGNDSAQINKRFKSPDLVGITPTLIGPQHIGRWLGVFTGFECKPSNWTFKGDEREIAQLAFHNIVRKAGGFAGFVSDPAQIWEIIK